MSPIVLAYIFVAYICFADGQSSCSTPNGLNGSCKSIYQCETLLKLINKKDRTQEEVDVLRKSQCGFMGSTPAVCCPESVADTNCLNPDGAPGRCINIYSCPHVANMLRPPVSKENMQYVQKSRCQSADTYSICCGPSPQKPIRGSCKATVSSFLPSRESECCGLDSRVGNKIIGGTATTVDQYPWMAMIEYVKSGKTKLLCGGSLISGRYVLTAGHCVVGAVLEVGTPTNIRLGEYDTGNDGPDCAPVEAGGMDCTEGIVVIPIEQIITHPEYNPINMNRRNDIALIRMTNLAPYTDFIRPICLPDTDITATQSQSLSMYAAGWGAVNTRQPSSTIKLHVELPYVPTNVCQPAYSVQGRKVVLWEKQLCAGGQAGKDTCKGDSGGPLMYENGRTYDLIGVVSFGPTPCALENIPGVYTKVFQYKDWIKSVVKA